MSQSVPKFARYKHFFQLTYALVGVIHHVRFQSSEDEKQIIAKERGHTFIDPPRIGTSSPGSRPRMALAFVTPRTKQRPWPWPKTVGRPFDHGGSITIFPSLCAFCREVVPTKPFTNTALYYKMTLESEPTPLATKWVGGFYGGSKANVGHYKMTLRTHFVVKTGCSEKSWFATKWFLEISL